ncbi:serine hydrolase domain-containing protein [Brevundimonas goettingensis]|uniref:Beta-lactamase family protein n=1 Tax=Brevundimonas goettingensis TaxID=2774190 RepID=A0A975C0J1_9CAUL|nr:serine hydrolase domain-containing protein [Brevundimonas goettingensis]QTC91501.1 beta-lactamase family protein [Brevundimonas goettingensis]
MLRMISPTTSLAAAATLGLLALAGPAPAQTAPLPSPAAVDEEVQRLMGLTHSKGLALAVIDDGKVSLVQAWGDRNARGEPLETDTVMYGASLTKAVFAWTVMQLVDEGKIDLDTPIADYLPKPLPEYWSEDLADRYADYRGLADDPRWRTITPRILLTHSAGFSNFGFLEPDGKLKIHFDPGSRYAYSGDGLILLQFVLEQGLGLDIGAEMQRRVFDRFGMPRTGMMWRPDFAANLADGWEADGSVEPHDERSKTRAAGSMDTTIADLAKFVAAYVRRDGLTPALAAELVRPQVSIRTATQFPSFQEEMPPADQHHGLSAGLGVVTFTGPQGPGFFKGGHNDSTGNTWVCIEASRRCVLILSNDVRSEAAFPTLVRFILGETGVPYAWEYGPQPAL